MFEIMLFIIILKRFGESDQTILAICSSLSLSIIQTNAGGLAYYQTTGIIK